MLWEILCSSNRVTVSVYIVRVFSSIEHQVFFIRTSRCNNQEGVYCSGISMRWMCGGKSKNDRVWFYDVTVFSLSRTRHVATYCTLVESVLFDLYT